MSDPKAGPVEGSDAARQRAAALIGRTLSDRYRIVSLVAMGGMGAVYRAEHLLMRKHVAVKVLHPEIEGFPELVARFEREAVAGAHIEHPNVATANDFGKFDTGSAFLVLGFIEGITLRELIDRGPVPPRRAAFIIRQVAAGLTAVHQKGIVHRDIKPRNIMVVEDKTRGEPESVRDLRVDEAVKLIDFGLAKVPVETLSPIARDVDTPPDLTAAGVVMGTIGYLAPEASLGTRSILPPADLYALGVVFFEMLCGRPPFDAPDAARLFLHHRTSPVPTLRQMNADIDVPPALEAIVRRLLEKDPEARYPTAASLVTALDEALGSTPSTAASLAPTSSGSLTPERGSPPPSAISAPFNAIPERKPGSRRVLVIGALLVMAAVIGFVVFGMPRSTDPAPAAASASSVASVTPPVEAASRPPPPHAPGALERLRTAADGEPGPALTVLVGLVDSEPKAFADRAVQTEAASIVETAGTKGIATDAAVDRLGSALGADGLDILYDLVAREQRGNEPFGRGATGPTARARTILAKPDTLARATPAMRIAYELRRAPCLNRWPLFARAAKDGDDRALEVLKAMQSPNCTRKDACCLEKNRQLEVAIADIQARLRQ